MSINMRGAIIFLITLKVLKQGVKMDDSNKLYNETTAALGKLSKDYPEQMQAFQRLMGAVEKKGALDEKQKEIIAVALSVIQHCHWCIAFHVKHAIDAGATKGEIMEACWMAVLMGGGPALMYAQVAMKALDDFWGK